ncbi:MAG TPA: hypothetical protein ENJ82_17495 [Bacteroidetes bacterium]|nr:hypothetical protein [Bacteroidota bacterium]
MKQVLVLLFITVVALFSGCGGSPESKYEHNGFHFTKPAGWEVNDEEFEDGVGSLFVEKEGFMASGLVSIIWYQNEVPLELLVETFMVAIGEDEGFTDFSATQTKPIVYGQYEGLGQSFSFKSEGFDYTGNCVGFSCGTFTVLVSYQGADEDSAENSVGFDILEASIHC